MVESQFNIRISTEKQFDEAAKIIADRLLYVFKDDIKYQDLFRHSVTMGLFDVRDHFDNCRWENTKVKP